MQAVAVRWGPSCTHWDEQPLAPASRHCWPCRRQPHPFSCHDSQSFQRSILDTARALDPGGPMQMGPHRTAPHRACSNFRGPSTRVRSRQGPASQQPARHDLVSDVEAHVDGLSLRWPWSSPTALRPTRRFAVPAAHLFLLEFGSVLFSFLSYARVCIFSFSFRSSRQSN